MLKLFCVNSFSNIDQKSKTCRKLYYEFTCKREALVMTCVFESLVHLVSYRGPVLSLAMGVTGEDCYSGGIDSTIRCWKIPSSNVDPYDMYGECKISNAYFYLVTGKLYKIFLAYLNVG